SLLRKDFDFDEFIDFYTASTWVYSLTGIHYGFWNVDTKTYKEARDNETKFVADLLDLKRGNLILDAGCGFGNEAIYMAKRDVEVTGISLIEKHIKMAQKNAQKRHIQNHVKFFVRDYTKTQFPKNTFDGVYGIESICYSAPRTKFLKEAFRV